MMDPDDWVELVPTWDVPRHELRFAAGPVSGSGRRGS